MDGAHALNSVEEARNPGPSVQPHQRRSVEPHAQHPLTHKTVILMTARFTVTGLGVLGAHAQHSAEVVRKQEAGQRTPLRQTVASSALHPPHRDHATNKLAQWTVFPPGVLGALVLNSVVVARRQGRSPYQRRTHMEAKHVLLPQSHKLVTPTSALSTARAEWAAGALAQRDVEEVRKLKCSTLPQRREQEAKLVRLQEARSHATRMLAQSTAIMDGQDGLHAPRRVVAVSRPGRSVSVAMVQMAGEDAHLRQSEGAATLMAVLALIKAQASTTTEEVKTYTSIGIPWTVVTGKCRGGS